MWSGYTCVSPVVETHTDAEAFAPQAGGRFTADSNYLRISGYSNGYDPGNCAALRTTVNRLADTAINREVEDTEGWYGWSLRWSSSFYCWEGIPAIEGFHATHPGYGQFGFSCPQAGQYGLQMKVGHCPSPDGSGMSDDYLNPGIGDFNPITPSSTANTTNKNGYNQTPILLGTGGAAALTLNKWHDFIMHVIWQAKTNGTLEIWHREEGAAGFTKLYSNQNDASAVINVAPHPTMQWNLKYGALGEISPSYSFINFQLYRGAPASNISIDYSPIRRRGSYALVETLFVGSLSAVPVNTTPPSITGTPGVGNELSCDTGTWENTPTSYAYQWKRDTAGDNNFANITGATTNTYTQVTADNGNRVCCDVTASNGSGAGQPARSNIISLTGQGAPALEAGEAPTLTGTAQVGSTLTCDRGAWINNPDTFAYQWQDEINDVWANIVGATSQTYVVAQSNLGRQIRTKVTASNEAGSTDAYTAPSDAIVVAAYIQTSGSWTTAKVMV